MRNALFFEDLCGADGGLGFRFFSGSKSNSQRTVAWAKITLNILQYLKVEKANPDLELSDEQVKSKYFLLRREIVALKK